MGRLGHTTLDPKPRDCRFPGEKGLVAVTMGMLAVRGMTSGVISWIRPLPLQVGEGAEAQWFGRHFRVMPRHLPTWEQ